MNPIINQMMNGFMSGFTNMFKQVKAAQNPNAMMQSMAQNNSQLGQTMSFINQNGGNAKQLYYSMCQQKDVDPNIIINNLKNM